MIMYIFQEYKVNWHLWDACQFLRKVNRTEKVMLDSVDMPEGEVCTFFSFLLDLTFSLIYVKKI